MVNLKDAAYPVRVEAGLLARIGPDAGQVCQSLIVVSNCMPGSPQIHVPSAIMRIRSRALLAATVLDHAVELRMNQGGTAGLREPVTLHAGHAEFERKEQLCHLIQARAEYAGGTADTGQAVVHFRDDGSLMTLPSTSKPCCFMILSASDAEETWPNASKNRVHFSLPDDETRNP